MTEKDKITKIIEELGFKNILFDNHKDDIFARSVSYLDPFLHSHTIEAETLEDIWNLLNGQVTKCYICKKKSKHGKRTYQVNRVDYIAYIRQKKIEKNISKKA